MRLADTIRREASTTGVDHGRYACRTYGIPLERDLDRCPECGHTTIAPIEDVIDPTFSD
jgi:endonuclease III